MILIRRFGLHVTIALTFFLLGAIAVDLLRVRQVSAAGNWGRGFYLTTGNKFTGATASTACSNGYHMASLWEIHNVSALTYNAGLGLTYPNRDSSLGGPPALISDATGWVRSGSSSNTQNNCQGWTSNSASYHGMSIGLPDAGYWYRPGGPFPANWMAPWVVAQPGSNNSTYLQCNATYRVWCVQD